MNKVYEKDETKKNFLLKSSLTFGILSIILISISTYNKIPSYNSLELINGKVDRISFKIGNPSARISNKIIIELKVNSKNNIEIRAENCPIEWKNRIKKIKEGDFIEAFIEKGLLANFFWEIRKYNEIIFSYKEVIDNEKEYDKRVIILGYIVFCVSILLLFTSFFQKNKVAHSNSIS